MVPDRTVLTVSRLEGVWRVEYGGESFGHSPDKEVAKAAANRHARSMLDEGKPCQVRVQGELGYGAA
ncbi:MAG TPA: hypothetical protein VF474_05380 [Phenylobacterium sp.]